MSRGLLRLAPAGHENRGHVVQMRCFVREAVEGKPPPDKFVFAGPTVDEGLVRELAIGSFLDAKRNAIFIGGIGTGKTGVAIGCDLT